MPDDDLPDAHLAADRARRRWLWISTAVLVVYVGTYLVLRATGDLYTITVPTGFASAGDTLVVDEPPALSSRPTWKRRLFAACIAVEEWWRAR